ncbi:MAG: TIGR03915 family putative DNA repair protein [Clostridia bacterium]|nr:TIGR03915 family putative DNA repair protein [Clostridia bacterium]
MRRVFITDASSVSFYTAVFLAYGKKEAYISSEKDTQLTIGDEQLFVEADREKAERVAKKITSIDRFAESEIDRVLRSNKKEKCETAFRYIKLLVREERPVRGMQSRPEIIALEECLHSVSREIDKFKGFIRFIETNDGVFYAPYSPDADITDLLMPHFIGRFSSQKFIIHDVGRGYAAAYDGKSWTSGDIGPVEIELSDDEGLFERLWTKYYDSVNIEERENIKQMKGFMPVRYWKFLPEKNGGDFPGHDTRRG